MGSTCFNQCGAVASSPYQVLRKPIKPGALRALLGALAAQRESGGSTAAPA
jgi:hypothetical protein